MKKCIFYLFAMLCTLSLFSCGDDNGKDDSNPDPGPTPDETWKEIAKDYTGDKLKLQFNGNELTTNTIKLETSSAEKGSVSLGNLIAGSPDLKVDVTLKTTKAETAVVPNYAIDGQKTIDSRTVSVTGSVVSGVLSLNVAVKVNSPVVGKWGLAPEPTPSDINQDGVINEMDYNLMAGCFFLSLESKTGSIAFGGQTIPDMQFCLFADQKAEAFLRASLQEVSFLENGTIVFTYLKDGQAMPLAGIAGYYVKDQLLYMTIDIMSIMGLMGTKAANDPITDLIAMAQNGIPLAFVPSEDGKTCSLLINKEMASALIPKLAPLMELLPAMIKDPAMLAMIQQIGGLLQTIAESNEFSVGINLVKK